MYTLLLIDDEEDVREGVVREIDWQAYGFAVVGTAENGQEALEKMERSVPDIVVTDIKMPFMDGLELAAVVKERYPTVKIVILTGFDEFEYARKAVKLQIDEYVLKPFSAGELIDALLKVRARLDEEAAEKKNIRLLKEHYQKSLPVLREVFLTSLITRRLPEADIREKAHAYQIDLEGNGFVVGAVSIDRPCVGEDPANRSAPPPIRQAWGEDRELLLFAVRNIVQEVVDKHRLGIVFTNNDHVVLIAVHQEREREAVLRKTAAVLEEARQFVEKFCEFTVTAGIGTVTGELADLSFSYEDAVAALDYRVVLGNNRVICVDDVEKRCVEKVRFDERKEHALIRCLKVGTPQELKDILDELFAEIAYARVSIKDYHIYLLEILTAILKAAKGANLDPERVFGENLQWFTDIHKSQTLQETKDRLLHICSGMMNSIASDRQSSYKRLVAQAVEYVKNHYHESDISIHKVCRQLHISAGYFSSIFKKEMNTTFVNFLLQVRMEAAQELLLTTDLKTFEIAERVGYADPNYFSFCFRKKWGMSPKEYKNMARGVR
ncbi:response regulator [Brevibacillus thermoruber]|uniref:response regulator n=1 Tax=Brevibacillus thermoruber TaxID=33942 RepID=UPI0040429C55